MSQYGIVAGRGRRVNHRQYPHVAGRRPDLASARQKSAAERQVIYNALDLDARLARIAGRRGESRRERTRILEQIRSSNVSTINDYLEAAGRL